ncbi:hypothetical protein STEG23_011434, partial [Scotinomys teguina]
MYKDFLLYMYYGSLCNVILHTNLSKGKSGSTVNSVVDKKKAEFRSIIRLFCKFVSHSRLFGCDNILNSSKEWFSRKYKCSELRLHLDKSSYFYDKYKKDGSCFHVHSVSLCLFIGIRDKRSPEQAGNLYCTFGQAVVQSELLLQGINRIVRDKAFSMSASGLHMQVLTSRCAVT